MTDKTIHASKHCKNNILISSVFIFLLCSCNTKQDNVTPKLPLPTNWNTYSLAQKDSINVQLNSQSFRQDEFKSKSAERTKVREHRLNSKNSPVSSFVNDAEWWLQFNDPVLNQLIEESLTGNSDIELAMSNVLAAKAQLNLVNSYRFPQINLQGGANRTKNSKKTKAPNEPKFSNNFGLASVLNYELDKTYAM